MRFSKMHGIGNDYSYAEAHRDAVLDPAAVARTVGDRHNEIAGAGLYLAWRHQV